jgi:conserved domain protein
MVLLSFWNYFYDKKKLFSRTQYEIREAVEGGKEAKVSDERDKVVQEMAMF